MKLLSLFSVVFLIMLHSSIEAQESGTRSAPAVLEPFQKEVSSATDTVNARVINQLLSDIQKAIATTEKITRMTLSEGPVNADSLLREIREELLFVKKTYNDLNNNHERYKREMNRALNQYNDITGKLENKYIEKRRNCDYMTQQIKSLESKIQRTDFEEIELRKIKTIAVITKTESEFLAEAKSGLSTMFDTLNVSKEAIDLFIEQGRANSEIVDALMSAIETAIEISEYRLLGENMNNLGAITMRMRTSLENLARVLNDFLKLYSDSVFNPVKVIPPDRELIEPQKH